MSVLLDWTCSEHWNHGRQAPCRLCGTPTLLVDAWGRPAHKVCLEDALAAIGWAPPPPAELVPADDTPPEDGDSATLFGPADVRRFTR